MNYAQYLQQGGQAPSIEDQVASLVQAAMQGDQLANDQINQIMLAAEQGDQKAQQLALLIQQVAQKLQAEQPEAMKCGGKVRAKVKKACFGKKMEKGGEAPIKKEAKGGKPCPCTLHKVGGKLVEVDCNGVPIAKDGTKITKFEDPSKPITYDYNHNKYYINNGKWFRQNLYRPGQGYEVTSANDIARLNAMYPGVAVAPAVQNTPATQSQAQTQKPSQQVVRGTQSGPNGITYRNGLTRFGVQYAVGSDGKMYMRYPGGNSWSVYDTQNAAANSAVGKQIQGLIEGSGYKYNGNGSFIQDPNVKEYSGPDFSKGETWVSQASVGNLQVTPQGQLVSEAARTEYVPKEEPIVGQGLFSGGLRSLQARQAWVKDNADYLRSLKWTEDEINGYKGQAALNLRLANQIAGAKVWNEAKPSEEERIRRREEASRPLLGSIAKTPSVQQFVLPVTQARDEERQALYSTDEDFRRYLGKTFTSTKLPPMYAYNVGGNGVVRGLNIPNYSEMFMKSQPTIFKKQGGSLNYAQYLNLK